MKSFKEKLLAACKENLRTKIEGLSFSMEEINRSMENETKSSLGDKHETSRARMQSELEKLSWQMDALKTQNELLLKINLEVSTESISHQNLVFTTRGIFFITIPLGKIIVDGKTIYVISAVSPLGKKLIGLKSGDIFNLNEQTYKIEEIL